MRESRATRVEIRLLGEFGVAVDGRPIPPCAWQPCDAAQMVKLLALSRRLPRERVIDALWARRAPEAGAAALLQATSQARSVLRASNAIGIHSGQVVLAPGAEVTIDLELFEQGARRALDGGSKELCAAAAALYAGELLPADRGAEWLDSRRERARALHLKLLRKAGLLADALAREPTDEEAQLGLMRLYAESGQRAAALREFRRLRTVLAEERGALPSGEAVALHEAVARGPTQRARARQSAPELRRDAELARARALLRQAGDGQGGTLFVRGEAGTGKTRWCELLLAEAAASGATTLRGAASEVEPGTSFHPIIEALERLLLMRPDLAERLTDSARALIARLASAAPRRTSTLEARVDRQQILAAVAEVLALAARERPLLFFVDDLHAADDSTLELLASVARAACFDRIVLLAALRPEPRPALERLRGALLERRAAVEIELGPLPHDECDSPPDLSSELEAELTLALERAAVLGERFESETFITFSGLAEERAFELLERGRERRVLEPAGAGHRFRQRLRREAILASMPEQRRQELEREAAVLLARSGASAACIAGHLLRAADLADAVAWFAQAARDAYCAAAYASALHFAELALEQTEDDADLLGLRAEVLLTSGDARAPAACAQALRSARAEWRDGLCIKACQAQLAAGELASARRWLAEVSDGEKLEDRVRQLLLRAELASFDGELDGAELAAEQGLALARVLGPSEWLSEAVRMRSVVAHGRGRWPEYARAQLLDLERVRDLAGAIHEGHLCGSESYLYRASSYAQVMAFARELLTAAERAGARRAVALALCLLGEAELLTGELGPAQQHLDRSLRLCLELGACGAAAVALQRLAEAALYCNHHARARELVDEALALARRSPHCRRHLLERVYGAKLRCGWAASQSMSVLDEAEAAIAGPSESCTACGITLSVPASISCARAGDLERARRYLERSERITALSWRGTTWEGALDEARATVAAAEGERTRADDLFAQAARRFTRAGQKLDAERCRQGREAL